jgi:hypothetical protein
MGSIVDGGQTEMPNKNKQIVSKRYNMKRREENK